MNMFHQAGPRVILRNAEFMRCKRDYEIDSAMVISVQDVFDVQGFADTYQSNDCGC